MPETCTHIFALGNGQLQHWRMVIIEKCRSHVRLAAFSFFQVSNNCTYCFFKTRGPFFKQCKHTTLSTAMTFCHQPGMLPARGSHAVIVLLCEVHLCGYTHCKKRLEPIQVSDHHGERRRPDPRPRQEHDCSAGADVIGVSCISCLLEARDMDALHHEHNRSARLLSRTQLHPNA